jgi:AcrR family transcriptional regulator
VADTVLTDTERPLRADARRNRERILQSARAVFAEYGADAQIDDVARQAGVGVGTVYRHFPTKEALLVELLREKFRLFSARARDALEQDGEPFAVIEDLLRRNAETAASDAAVQHALAGAGEHIWMQAQAEQQELVALTEDLIANARRPSLRPVRGRCPQPHRAPRTSPFLDSSPVGRGLATPAQHSARSAERLAEPLLS